MAPSNLSWAPYVYMYIPVLRWKFNRCGGGWIQMCTHTEWRRANRPENP